MIRFLLAAALALSPFSALAADNNTNTPSGATVPQHVADCLNSSSLAVPCSVASPLPVATNEYPSGATAVVGVSAGADTTSATAQLAGTTGKTTYVCGFTVSGLGATALTNIVVTVGNVIGAVNLSYEYSMPAGATVVATTLSKEFTRCIPANATNTAITLTVGGGAGNTQTNLEIHGYQL